MLQNEPHFQVENSISKNRTAGSLDIIGVIFRRPGCLRETQWAFRPTLADGLVLSSIVQLFTNTDTTFSKKLASSRIETPEKSNDNYISLLHREQIPVMISPVRTCRRYRWTCQSNHGMVTAC
jgi:hypothetical protein